MIRFPVAKIPFKILKDMALVPLSLEIYSCILVNYGYVKEIMNFGKRK